MAFHHAELAASQQRRLYGRVGASGLYSYTVKPYRRTSDHGIAVHPSMAYARPQQFLNSLPLPQGQGFLRAVRSGGNAVALRGGGVRIKAASSGSLI